MCYDLVVRMGLFTYELVPLVLLKAAIAVLNESLYHLDKESIFRKGIPLLKSLKIVDVI